MKIWKWKMKLHFLSHSPEQTGKKSQKHDLQNKTSDKKKS